MKKLLITVLVLGLVAACGSESPDQSGSTAKTESSATPAVDGEKIYKQYCIACHGLYGDMGASGAANLQVSALGLDERVKVITEGRTGTAMVSFTTLLDEAKIKAVADYTMTLKKTGE